MLTELFDRSLQRAQASPHAADLEAFAAGLQVSRCCPVVRSGATSAGFTSCSAQLASSAMRP